MNREVAWDQDLRGEEPIRGLPADPQSQVPSPDICARSHRHATMPRGRPWRHAEAFQTQQPSLSRESAVAACVFCPLFNLQRGSVNILLPDKTAPFNGRAIHSSHF